MQTWGKATWLLELQLARSSGVRSILTAQSAPSLSFSGHVDFLPSPSAWVELTTYLHTYISFVHLRAHMYGYAYIYVHVPRCGDVYVYLFVCILLIAYIRARRLSLTRTKYFVFLGHVHRALSQYILQAYKYSFYQADTRRIFTGSFV